MHAVVLGAAGFLGSHLVDRLLGEGWRVTGVDNLLTGVARNLSHLRDEPRFDFVEHDVSRPFVVDGDVDGVLHLASPASPSAYLETPVETLLAGSLGTYHTLGLARRHGARYLLASTSEVYGDPLVHPQHEEYWGNANPVGLRSSYDEAKRYAEALTFAYRRKHGTDAGVARIFNTYGPRMRTDDGRVVSNLVVQALRGEPLTIYGDGTQTRSFCYVDDLVEGLYRLFRSDLAGPVNVGNPREITILELATAIQAEAGSSLPLVNKPLPEDDPTRRCPDISLAERALNWRPHIDLREGIRRTVAHFREQLGGE